METLTSINSVFWHFAMNGTFRGSKKSKFNSLSQTLNRTVLHLGYLEYTLTLDESFLFFSFLSFDRF